MTATAILRWKRKYKITLTLACSFMGVHNDLSKWALVSWFFFGVFPAQLLKKTQIVFFSDFLIMLQCPPSLPKNIMHTHNKKKDYNEITQQHYSRFL